MERQNYIANSFDIANQDNAAKLDGAAKRVLALKPILARILQGCIKEYENSPIENIENRYIEGTPSIAQEPLHEDDIPPAIIGANSEHKTRTEGTSTFDIKFNALAPNGEVFLQFIINIEAQNKDKYSLLKRGIYYCGRMLSAQYGKIFTSPYYNKLRKVISIWICFDPSEGKANTINSYTLKEKNLAGMYKAQKTEYNLVDVIIISLGDDKDTNNALLKMLDKIFSKQYTVDEKKSYLESECGIAMTETVSKEVSEMCNYSVYIKDQGKAEGITEGKIINSIEYVLDGLLTPETAAAKLRMTVVRFTELLEQYKATGTIVV